MGVARPPRSDHFDGDRFFNPHQQVERSVGDVITWQRTREKRPWPEHVPLAPQAPPPERVPPGAMAVTFIGHSSFLIRTSEAVILTDPVFTTHAGPFGRLGPRRVRAPGVPLEALPAADLVLVSHNHYDHLQPSSLRTIGRAGNPAFVTSLGLASYLRRLGLRQVFELDWWEAAAVPRADVTAVPAQHFSARTPWDRNRTLWSGFIVRSGGVSIYFAGDTGYSPHFAEIGRRYPDVDLALIPIGAYEPRWFMQPVHVNPDEAVRIHRDVRPRVSVAMHFGTFQLTDEGIDDPVHALHAARAAHGIAEHAFRTIDAGETLVIGPR